MQPKTSRELLVVSILISLSLCLPVAAAPESDANAAAHPEAVTDAQLFAALDLARPGLEQVRAAVEAEDYAAAAEAWTAYFRGRATPTALFNRDRWAASIRERFPSMERVFLAKAESLAGGRIDHGPVRLPVEDGVIRWAHNPNRDTNYVSIVGSQWFMFPLGRAYMLASERGEAKRAEGFADAFAWIFGSWYDHQDVIRATDPGAPVDPIYYSYYPGVRSRILAENYYAMGQSKALTPELHMKVMKQLLGACSWLYVDNAQYKPGNQQVAAVIGLGVVGLMFPEFHQAQAWYERADKWMARHLEEDFFEDGGHKELCTQYHKTVLRDVGALVLTAAANGRESRLVNEDLERAYDWLAKLVMPGAYTPALHSAVFATDYGVHLLLGNRLFDRPDWLWLAHDFWKQDVAPVQKVRPSLASYLLSGELAYDPEKVAKPENLPGTVHLETSGIIVARSGWEPEDQYFLLQYGWPESTHGYPGALAFCYEAGGELVATMPGSPRSYASPHYEKCHATPAHNVVSIDGASYSKRGQRAAGGVLHRFADMDGAWYIRASHEGYKEMFGATVEREVFVVEGGPVVVRDRVRGAVGRMAQWNFHTPLAASQEGVGVQLGADWKLLPGLQKGLAGPVLSEQWMAVPPAMQPENDCGKVVPHLVWEKPIGEDGAEFCFVLTKGPASFQQEDAGRFVLASDAGNYIFAFAGANGLDGAEALASKGDTTWIVEPASDQ
jgi:hypothetical protein